MPSVCGSDGVDPAVLYSCSPGAGPGNTGVEGFVTRLYNICLDRDPDPAGFNAWVNQLKSGANTGAEAAYGFVFSNEFKSKNPCNTDYIASLYRCFLGREPDSAGMSAWLAASKPGIPEALFLTVLWEAMSLQRSVRVTALTVAMATGAVLLLFLR